MNKIVKINTHIYNNNFKKIGGPLPLSLTVSPSLTLASMLPPSLNSGSIPEPSLTVALFRILASIINLFFPNLRMAVNKIYDTQRHIFELLKKKNNEIMTKISLLASKVEEVHL